MREKFLQARDAAYAAYFEAVCAIKKAARGPVTPPTTRQEGSTARLLSMDDATLATYRARPLPDDYKAKPTGTFVEDDKDVEVGRRAVAEREVWLYRWTQHRQDRNDAGQPELKHDAGFRERGIEAFMKAKAYGGGRQYHELRPDEKGRVCNYFIEGLQQLGTAEAQAKQAALAKAVLDGDEATVEQILQEELKVT